MVMLVEYVRDAWPIPQGPIAEVHVYNDRVWVRYENGHWWVLSDAVQGVWKQRRV